MIPLRVAFAFILCALKDAADVLCHTAGDYEGLQKTVSFSRNVLKGPMELCILQNKKLAVSPKAFNWNEICLGHGRSTWQRTVLTMNEITQNRTRVAHILKYYLPWSPKQLCHGWRIHTALPDSVPFTCKTIPPTYSLPVSFNEYSWMLQSEMLNVFLPVCPNFVQLTALALSDFILKYTYFYLTLVTHLLTVNSC